MEKNRKARKGILIVLLLVVVGLSIGFAGFSDILKITNMTASVSTSEDTFRVVFSTSETEEVGGAITTDGTYAQTATIQPGVTQISNLTATFTAPNQKATWEVYAYNAGEFDAFLNSVTVGAVTAVAGDGTDPDKVTAALDGINVSVNVGNVEYTETSGELSTHILQKQKGEKVVITLTYEDGSAIADGDFTVNVGEIALNYGSID